jgi:SAM-dependent methyltransferase
MFQKIVDRLRLTKSFFGSARRRGLVRTLKISLYEVWFERKFGSTTGFVIPIERLDYTDTEAREHAGHYFPSSYLFLYEALAKGPIDCRGLVFVDYGCGMGRALLFAATLPFKRIIGVELSHSLCQTATHNLETYYRTHRITTPEWAIVNADARLFQIPDDATVFYLFNSFDAVILTDVLDKLIASTRSAPRKCYLVYANPQHKQLISERGFEKIAQAGGDYIIYSFGPSR